MDAVYPRNLESFARCFAPIETLKPADLGVNPAPRLTVLKVTEPPRRNAGARVASVADLVSKLRTEAKVI